MKFGDKMDFRDYYNGSEEDLEKISRTWSVGMVQWKDHVSEFPDVRRETDLGNNLIRHERFDGAVFVEGTPITAENLGAMDFNIYMLELKYKALRDDYNQLKLESMTQSGAISSNTPYNMFILSCRDINNIDSDLKIVEGFYDEKEGRCYV